MTPASGQTGTSTITVTVSDGTNSASDSFVLTVTASNTPPTISTIANQSISVNGTTGPMNFTVGDANTPAGNLTLGRSSSNPTLVPTNNIVFGGSGSNRTVTVTPTSGQTGSVTIAISVSDGQLSASSSFLLTVGSASTGTKSFTNSTAIVIPDRGAATPYPSIINVTGLSGAVSNVTLTLRNLSHTWTRDIDVMLVGPAGQKVIVMSDAGSGGANNVTFTLSDAAATSLPTTALTSGTYRPANYTDTSSGGDNFPSPAPASPYATTLSAFNAQQAVGAWSLYVFDDGPGDQGSFAGGWTLTISTAGVASAGVPGAPLKALRITSARLDAARTMHVTILGEVGRSYALEATTDWSNWLRADERINSSGTLELTEPATTDSSRFYRVVLLP